MVKKQEEMETPEVETPEVETPEVTPPTPEEQLATLQKELDKTKVDLDSRDKGLRTAHQTLTEKDKELKKRTDIDTRLDGFEETQRILAATMSERLASGEGLDPTEKTDYLKQFDDIAKRQKVERETLQAKGQQDEYNRQADAVYVRAKEAFKDDEDAIERVEDLLSAGRLERAEARVAKAEKPTDTKGESEGDKEEKIREDERKKLYEKYPSLLVSDAGGPSGASGMGIPTKMEDFRKWIANLSQTEYEELKPEIDKMQAAGKIK